MTGLTKSKSVSFTHLLIIILISADFPCLTLQWLVEQRDDGTCLIENVGTGLYAWADTAAGNGSVIVGTDSKARFWKITNVSTGNVYVCVFNL